MAEDLAGTTVTANILLPGGGTATGMLPEDLPAELRAAMLDRERVVATVFDQWLSAR